MKGQKQENNFETREIHSNQTTTRVMIFTSLPLVIPGA